MLIEDHSDDFYRELNIKSLRNHYVRASKEYEQLRTMLNALSYDQEVLTEEQAIFLKKSFKQRIQYIEDTIDIHLNVIDGLEKHIEQSYMYKLRVLQANEYRITKKYDPLVKGKGKGKGKKKKKAKKSNAMEESMKNQNQNEIKDPVNRNGEPYAHAQRLTDFAQSYNLFDAEEFHREKQVLDKLDREILELEYLGED